MQAEERECAERADATRNREHLLVTARAMLATHGVAGMTMDALAREAGLGKGTVFRRFGSRAGLLQALLQETETEFQQAFLSGPPPLGPGAEPVERIVAFGRARLAMQGVRSDLHNEIASAPEVRAAWAPRSAGHVHLQMLLRQAKVEADVPVLALHLLAALDASMTHHESGPGGIPRDRLADGWEDLVRRLVP